MRNLPVHWHEGLFLRPQHFQAADRYWTELLQTSARWDNPYNYGLVSISFSREAIANQQFQIDALQARMRDGTIVSLEAGQEPDRVDLKEAVEGLRRAQADLTEAFEKDAVVRVYLAVPKLKIGRANVGSGGSNGDPRYLEARASLQDESEGGNDQEVQLRCLNVKLLLSTQDRTGYEVLPIAQIKRAGEGEARPQVDPEYIPPLLNIQSWPPLGRDIVRAVYDIVGQKIEVLSQQIVNRGVGLDSRQPGDIDRVLMLTQLNEAYGALAVLAFAEGVHPLTAYTELCRTAARLAVFTPQRRAADIPPYDHEDLARIFTLIRTRIEAAINAVRDYEFQQRFFIGVGLGMQASLEPKWFNSDWQWFIGVRKGELTVAELRDLLSPGQLDWKFGSSRQVEVLFTHRAEGLELSLVDRPIRALPAGQDWVYYEVARRDTPAWRDVQETMTLAMRLRDSLILNLDQLQGERKLVVSFRGRRVPLEFALFAVPVQS